jgi:NAD-dependent deacetylase
MVMGIVQKLITARPNIAHKVVGKLYKKGYVKAVVTQNIDNLHQRGGAKEVIEVHGTYKTASCMNCSRKFTFEQLMQMVLQDGTFPPTCEECGGIIKPDVVFFGEMLPPIAIRKSMEYAEQCDLMLVLGSSLVVYPVANLPNIAKANPRRAKLVIINDEETPKDYLADLIINGRLGEIMPKLLEEVEALEAKK